jgi:hypothetical protein
MALILTLSLAGGWTLAQAQTPPPDSVAAVVGMQTEDGQKRLQSMGYEIVYAKSKTQYWWNEKAKACLDVTIKGGKIESVRPIDDGQCASRAEAARKVWEAYADGQADVHGKELDQERSRAAADGYKASYWVKNISADKANSIEYWYNEKTDKCMFLVFRTADGKLFNKSSCESARCKNPAPKRGS